MVKKLQLWLGILAFLFVGMVWGVSAQASDITSYYAMNVGEQEQIEINTIGEIAFYVFNTKVATVTEDGIITAVGKGSTLIKAETEEDTYYYRVSVKVPSIKINKTSAEIYYGGNVGNYVELKATVAGARNVVTWESSDTGVAKVNCIGKVTATGIGETTITATCNGVSASCQIRVTESILELPVQDIQLMNKGKGNSYTIKPITVGAKGKVEWSSSDDKVATVKNGKITGKTQGEAVITASYNGLIQTCNVTVVEKALAVDNEHVQMYVGGTKTETAKLTAYYDTRKVQATWKTSNGSVATVDASGNVWAVGAGEAVLTAHYNGKEDSCKITVKDTAIRLSDTEISLNTKGKDYTYKLTAEVAGKSNKVTWTTSDKSIATVSGGKVTGKGQGTAIITATANGVSAQCTVHVTKTEIILDKTAELNADTQDTLILSPVVTGLYDEVEWKTSNSSVATVENGVITPIKQGKVKITATANGISASCNVTVKKAVTVLDKKELILYVTSGKGKSAKLKASVTGDNKEVTWSTSDASIATVDEKGNVTAVGAGSATICATANGKTDICDVTVLNSTVTLNTDNVVLTKDYYHHSETVTADVVGYSKTVTWKSSDNKVATVSKGVITAKGTGTATITASANGITAFCRVEVTETGITEPVITLDKENILLTKNSSKNKTATIKANVAGPEDKIVWTSSDPSVVTVKNGKLTAKKVGSVIITATANEVSATCAVEVTENKVILNQNALSLNTDGKNTYATLSATVEGTYTDSVVWKSSNEKVATVNAYGKVAAVGKGSAKITATVNGVTATCSVKVIENAVKLNKISVKLYENAEKNSSVTIKATVKGVDKTVLWTSSDETVATVTDNGTITAVGGGACIVTAKANGITAVCEVSVVGNRIKLNKEKIVLNMYGEVTSETLEATVEGATSKVTWKSLDEKVATVSMGVVTAVGEGNTVITAEANGLLAQCAVEVVDDHIHDYQSEITREATCSLEGIRTVSCSICKDTYTEAIAKTDHQWSEWQIERQPTETEDGMEKRSCDNCDAEETKTIPSLTHEHSYKETVTAPTCTEQGYTTHSCTCGDSYVDTYINALDHNWGDWVITKQPTEQEEGREERSCQRCGKIESNSLEKLEHTHVYSIFIRKYEPACIDRGWSVYQCQCGARENRDFVDMLGHNPEWKVTKEPNCTENGREELLCTRCNVCMNSTSIPMTGHEYRELENTVSEENGVGHISKECNICQDTLVEYYVDFGESPESIFNGETYQLELISDLDEKLLPYLTYDCDARFCNATRFSCEGVTISDTGLVSVNVNEFENLENDVYALIGVSLKENPYNAVIVQDSKYVLSNIMGYTENLAYSKIKDEIIPQIITGDMNDAEKIIAAHDWIVENVDYVSTSYCYEAYGAICNKEAVCLGYAKAFDAFMKILDIPCVMVSSESMNHAWNMVQLDGEWYWIDTTWDDPVGTGFHEGYTYFLLKGVRAADQRGTFLSTLPECTGEKWRIKTFDKYHATTAEEVKNLMIAQKNHDRIILAFHSRDELSAYNNFMSEFSQRFGYSLAPSYSQIEEETIDGVYYEDFYMLKIVVGDKLRTSLTELEGE